MNNLKNPQILSSIGNRIFRFIKKFLGAPSDSDVDSLRSENEKLKEQVSTLEARVGELEKELEAARESQ